jgi:hypothetical protein
MLCTLGSTYSEDTVPAMPAQKKKKKRKHKKRKQRRDSSQEADDERDDMPQDPPKTLTPLVTRKPITSQTIVRSSREPVIRNGPMVAGVTTKRYNAARRSDDTPDYASDFDTDSIVGSNQLRSHPILGPIGSTRNAEEDNTRSNSLLPVIPLGRSSLVSNSMNAQDDDRATTV